MEFSNLQIIYPEELEIQPTTEIIETQSPIDRGEGLTMAQYYPPSEENFAHKITINSHDHVGTDVMNYVNAPFEATSLALHHQIAADYWHYHFQRVGDLMKIYGRKFKNELLSSQTELSTGHEFIHRTQKIRGLLVEPHLLPYTTEDDNESIYKALVKQYNAATTSHVLAEFQAGILGYKALQHRPDIQAFMFGREYGRALYLLEPSPTSPKLRIMDMAYAMMKEGLDLNEPRESELQEIILLLTRNPNITEEIRCGKISRKTFKKSIREGLRMLGKHPDKLLEALLSEDFQKPLDQKLILATNNLKDLTQDIAKYRDRIKGQHSFVA